MKYDLVVIGGGPAGMMAAGKAGETGARVLLLEKNRSLGLKFLLTGNGRCNLTNAADEIKIMAGKFGAGGKFLLSSLSRFGPQDVIDFFNSRGVRTKIEEGGKVFPESDKARDVLAALLLYLEDFKVNVRTGAEVKKIVKKDSKIEKVVLRTGEEIAAENFLIAAGGRSYPLTGSTGDAYAWLKDLGHKIIEPCPALVPIMVKEAFVKDIEGASLSGAVIGLYENSKKIGEEEGEAMFTASGLTGPAVINLSRQAAKLNIKELSLRIDSVPLLDFAALDEKIADGLQAAGAQMIKNYLNEFWPPKMILPLLKEAGIDPEKRCHDVVREERKSLVHLLKELKLEIKSLAGWDKAVITAGGVDLKEVDPKTMESKIVSNLYLAGEILDLDGPTGGYNLQACWSTGQAAGRIG